MITQGGNRNALTIFGEYRNALSARVDIRRSLALFVDTFVLYYAIAGLEVISNP